MAIYSAIIDILALCLIVGMAIHGAKNGFINGASMFSMADVNLMFTAPLKEKSVLTFGLFQQLGKSLTLGLFILYQSSLVNNTYGLPITSLFAVLIGYGTVVFTGQMTATLIYALTCSDDQKVKKGKIIFFFGKKLCIHIICSVFPFILS